MERDAKTYFYDIRQSCRLIRDFTQDVEFQTYTTDWLIKSAVERQFIIIVEVINRLKQTDETAYRKISQAGKIVGFRNILVHGYEAISDQLVWEVVQIYLKELEELCEQEINA